MLQDTTSPTLNRRRITLFVGVLGVGLIITSFLVNTPAEVLSGELAILTSPSILITDYIAYANLGAGIF